MSCGSSITDMFYRVGRYAGRVLGGSNPAELPVEQIDRLEHVINGKTARAFGLGIPPSIAVGTDDVAK